LLSFVIVVLLSFPGYTANKHLFIFREEASKKDLLRHRIRTEKSEILIKCEPKLTDTDTETDSSKSDSKKNVSEAKDSKTSSSSSSSQTFETDHQVLLTVQNYHDKAVGVAWVPPGWGISDDIAQAKVRLFPSLSLCRCRSVCVVVFVSLHSFLFVFAFCVLQSDKKEDYDKLGFVVLQPGATQALGSLSFYFLPVSHCVVFFVSSYSSSFLPSPSPSPSACSLFCCCSSSPSFRLHS
jgi:hypothetical protein